MSRRAKDRGSKNPRQRRAGTPRRFLVSRSTLVWLGFSLIFWPMPKSANAVVETTPAFSEGWRRLESLGGRGELPGSLAQAGNGDVAVGDLAGVSWWRDDVRERAVLPFVRDLAFDSSGVLWIATEGGLYFWHRADRPTRRRLPGGEASNRVHRIAVSNSTMLLATGAGAFWSSDGRIFQLLRVAGAASAVSHVAIRAASFDRSATPGEWPHPGRTQAWVLGTNRLSLVRGLEASSGIRVTDVQSVPLPRPGGGVGGDRPVDLVIDPSGGRLFFVFGDAIAWRSIEDGAFSSESAGWRFARPGLPPGAIIRRLGWAAGRVWIATDHGLLEGQTLEGPFQRTASPVGTTDCVDIQSRTGGQTLALCRAGLFALDSFEGGQRETLAISLPAFSLPTLPPDPPLEEIRRRAMVRAGLTARRADGMWERLRRRAFWPEVGLRFDADFNSDDQRDDDQAFLSGDTRRLFDHTRDEGRSYQATIELDWDLGGVVYPLETVDLSRELRQVVSLRDDVADEINQLYFERQTIREKLAGPAPAAGSIEAGEVARLHWRAQELDAGLDAWTGGWISRWRAHRPVESGSAVHLDYPDYPDDPDDPDHADDPIIPITPTKPITNN
jgi:hypothetical protein